MSLTLISSLKDQFRGEHICGRSKNVEEEPDDVEHRALVVARERKHKTQPPFLSPLLLVFTSHPLSFRSYCLYISLLHSHLRSVDEYILTLNNFPPPLLPPSRGFLLPYRSVCLSPPPSVHRYLFLILLILIFFYLVTLPFS